jgi:hypothetical protein
MLLKGGQYPVAEGLQAIARSDRTGHLDDGRAVRRGYLDSQPNALFVGIHLLGISGCITGGVNSACCPAPHPAIYWQS